MEAGAQRRGVEGEGAATAAQASMVRALTQLILLMRDRREKEAVSLRGGIGMSSRTVELTGVRRCVVKVFVLSSAPNWSSPWQKRPQRSSSGSGFCINAERRQVITNAHVVQDAAPRYGS